MKRGLFTVLAGVSLVLCVAVCVLWVRSYWLMERVTWTSVNGYRSVWTARGSVEVGLFVAKGSYKPAETFGPKYMRDTPNGPGNWLLLLDFDMPFTQITWKRAGFAWYEIREGRTGTVHAIAVVPFWFIAMATALLPLGWTTRRWRSGIRERRLKNLGLCPSCGYDLRASPERCPECGTDHAKAIQSGS